MAAELPDALRSTLIDDLATATERIEPSAKRLFQAFAAGLER